MHYKIIGMVIDDLERAGYSKTTSLVIVAIGCVVAIACLLAVSFAFGWIDHITW